MNGISACLRRSTKPAAPSKQALFINILWSVTFDPWFYLKVRSFIFCISRRSVLSLFTGPHVPTEKPLTTTDEVSTTVEELPSTTEELLYTTEDATTEVTAVSFRAMDCQKLQAAGVLTSGVYEVWPKIGTKPVRVRCDMDTDGGGWTVSI